MLFAISWVPTSGLTEDRDKRTLKLFSNWRPPASVEFKGFYDYADGNGGIAIVEASSAEAMLETTAPWTTFFSFTVRPSSHQMDPSAAGARHAARGSFCGVRLHSDAR